MDGWTIFMIILISVLLVAGITFLVLWLTKKTDQPDIKKELAITGLNVKLTNNTTVNAIWTSVGNPSDQVTMYADTKRINFDAEGKPESTTSNFVPSSSVNGSVGTVSINTLKINTKYFVDVLVTNPGIKGYNAKHFTIFTQTTVPINMAIKITELDVDGAITFNPDNQTVSYISNSTNKTDNDAWLYNVNGDNKLINSNGYYLYNNNGQLSAISDLTNINSSNSEWAYSANGDNKWCLKNNSTLCMSIDTNFTTSTPIKVISNSKSQWQNSTIILV